jgi:hypothetical protein
MILLRMIKKLKKKKLQRKNRRNNYGIEMRPAQQCTKQLFYS